MTKYPTATVVREKALDWQGGHNQRSRTIEVLHKVIGVVDLYAWSLGNRVIDEVPVPTVKKAVTNDPDAKKEEVLASLDQFVGQHDYACDDESDATAVGIAWLLREGKLDSPYEQKDADPKPKRGRRKKGDDDAT